MTPTTPTLEEASTPSQNNELIQMVLKENRKLIAENLKDVLGAADYIFEQGFLTREDYNEIERIEEEPLSPIQLLNRSLAFIDLLYTKENEVLDILIEYLEKSIRNENSDENPSEGLSSSSSSSRAALLLLYEKLKSSREKFNPKKGDLNGNKSERPNLNLVKSPIDSTDFTMTLNGLEKIYHKILRRNEKVHKNWDKVISNINGLNSVDLFKLKQLMMVDDESEEDLFPVQQQQQQLGNSKNYWEQIIMKTFSLWKERNGPNATFFSLVGIFQESRLVDVADSLLDMKDEIQKAPLLKKY